MPVYVFRCAARHVFDARVPLERRDEPQRCPDPGCVSRAAEAWRVLTPPQRQIVRPAGYSLRPGDAGYWDFETAEGRLAPHERRRIPPFARAEALYKAPPAPADDDVPVVL